jgi:hypothetical protein
VWLWERACETVGVGRCGVKKSIEKRPWIKLMLELVKHLLMGFHSNVCEDAKLTLRLQVVKELNDHSHIGSPYGTSEIDFLAFRRGPAELSPGISFP